jgi:hypothetical protein
MCSDVPWRGVIDLTRFDMPSIEKPCPDVTSIHFMCTALERIITCDVLVKHALTWRVLTWRVLTWRVLTWRVLTWRGISRIPGHVLICLTWCVWRDVANVIYITIRLRKAFFSWCSSRDVFDEMWFTRCARWNILELTSLLCWDWYDMFSETLLTWSTWRAWFLAIDVRPLAWQCRACRDKFYEYLNETYMMLRIWGFGNDVLEVTCWTWVEVLEVTLLCSVLEMHVWRDVEVMFFTILASRDILDVPSKTRKSWRTYQTRNFLRLTSYTFCQAHNVNTPHARKDHLGVNYVKTSISKHVTFRNVNDMST